MTSRSSSVCFSPCINHRISRIHPVSDGQQDNGSLCNNMVIMKILAIVNVKLLIQLPIQTPKEPAFSVLIPSKSPLQKTNTSSACWIARVPLKVMHTASSFDRTTFHEEVCDLYASQTYTHSKMPSFAIVLLVRPRDLG